MLLDWRHRRARGEGVGSEQGMAVLREECSPLMWNHCCARSGEGTETFLLLCAVSVRVWRRLALLYPLPFRATFITL